MVHLETFVKEDIQALKVMSDGFADHQHIPVKYTCDGKNMNPPLNIDNIPKKAKSLVLIVDDPDAPIRAWVHWLVWNISLSRTIKEHSIPGIEGVNDFGQHNYGGPCPHSGTHHYHFKVYALDEILYLSPDSGKHELERAMSPHIIAFGELVGLYERIK